MPRLALLFLVWLPLVAQDGADPTAEAAALRSLIARTPRFNLYLTIFRITPPREGWDLGMVSSVAVDAKGVVYLLQRGDRADPVIAVSPEGRVLRSWGRGLYRMPHSLRLDPQGNIGTTDAATSRVIKFAPDGKKLLEIAAGGQPDPCRNNFCGTTDVAFGPNGRVFVTDGYANARVLEYNSRGKPVRQWGRAGTGPGEFHLPHSIAIDPGGVVYVADRENGRIQRFDLEGRYLGEWQDFGKTFGLEVHGEALWIGTQPRNEPNGSPGWVLKIDRRTGKLLGQIDAVANHFVAVTDRDEVFSVPGRGGIQWFREGR
ncbi:MAG: peptidyl-alpha-hydroxyglycine alpha-amidating lyase family protein [Bryobacteraceae bacterium]